MYSSRDYSTTKPDQYTGTQPDYNYLRAATAGGDTRQLYQTADSLKADLYSSGRYDRTGASAYGSSPSDNYKNSSLKSSIGPGTGSYLDETGRKVAAATADYRSESRASGSSRVRFDEVNSYDDQPNGRLTSKTTPKQPDSNYSTSKTTPRSQEIAYKDNQPYAALKSASRPAESVSNSYKDHANYSKLADSTNTGRQPSAVGINSTSAARSVGRYDDVYQKNHEDLRASSRGVLDPFDRQTPRTSNLYDDMRLKNDFDIKQRAYEQSKQQYMNGGSGGGDVDKKYTSATAATRKPDPKYIQEPLVEKTRPGEQRSNSNQYDARLDRKQQIDNLDKRSTQYDSNYDRYRAQLMASEDVKANTPRSEGKRPESRAGMDYTSSKTGADRSARGVTDAGKGSATTRSSLTSDGLAYDVDRRSYAADGRTSSRSNDKVLLGNDEMARLRTSDARQNFVSPRQQLLQQQLVQQQPATTRDARSDLLRDKVQLDNRLKLAGMDKDDRHVGLDSRDVGRHVERVDDRRYMTSSNADDLTGYSKGKPTPVPAARNTKATTRSDYLPAEQDRLSRDEHSRHDRDRDNRYAMSGSREDLIRGADKSGIYGTERSRVTSSKETARTADKTFSGRDNLQQSLYRDDETVNRRQASNYANDRYSVHDDPRRSSGRAGSSDRYGQLLKEGDNFTAKSPNHANGSANDRYSVYDDPRRSSGRAGSADRYGQLLREGDNFTAKSSLRADEQRVASRTSQSGELDRLRQEMRTPHHVSQKSDRKSPSVPKPAFVLKADVSAAKYWIVEDLLEKLGFTVVRGKKQECSLIWNDSYVSIEKIAQLQSHQRINHFTGMADVCKRDKFARLLSKMASALPTEYSFIPKTWVLPDDVADFQRYNIELKKKGYGKVYIMKSCDDSQKANVIELSMSWENCVTACSGKEPEGTRLIVQDYIDKPLLLDGHKFHLRLYVLITNVNPLCCFVYRDGILYMAGEKYLTPADDNLDRLLVHITTETTPDGVQNSQYADNRQLFEQAKRQQKKITLSTLLDRLSKGDSQSLWSSLVDLVLKTVVVIHPHVHQSYQLCRVAKNAVGSVMTPSAPVHHRRQHHQQLQQQQQEESVCFEVLGFDVLIDRTLKPFLLQVNRSPSFAVTPGDDLEYQIKTGVVEDTLRMLNFTLPVQMDIKQKERAVEILNEMDKDDAEATDNKPKVSTKKSEVVLKPEFEAMIRQLKVTSVKQPFSENCGNFRQIFPPHDKTMLDKYLKLMEVACSLCEPGIADKQKDEIKKFIIQKEREAMESSLEKDREKEQKTNKGGTAEKELIKVEIDEKTMDNTLKALKSTQITYPGKTDKAALQTLEKIRSNWKLYKKHVANYWFISLDSNKQAEVISIVRNKVREVVQKQWRCSQVEKVGVFRTFNRVFNRLLANRGQGLWECFTSNRSWEPMLSKSTESVSAVEMDCCRRVVEMCCDCLLIVYSCAVRNHSIPSPLSLATAGSPTTATTSSQVFPSSSPSWEKNQMYSSMTAIKA